MSDPLPPVTVWLREEMRRGKARSLRQIARYTGLSPDTVKNIYDGIVTRPEPETIRKLAEYFGVSADELMAMAGYTSQAPAAILPELVGLPIEDVLARLPERDRTVATHWRSLFRTREGWEWAVRILVSDILRSRRADKDEGEIIR